MAEDTITAGTTVTDIIITTGTDIAEDTITIMDTDITTDADTKQSMDDTDTIAIKTTIDAIEDNNRVDYRDSFVLIA